MFFKGFLLGGISYLIMSSQAVALVNTITITATVLSQPCTINDGNPIDVDFGDNLSPNKLDGNHYLKKIDYSLDCSDGSDSNLKLEFSGENADFNSALLATNREGLGIKIFADNKELPINNWFSFSGSNPPELNAVPVPNSASTVSTGYFSASATLSVDYQ